MTEDERKKMLDGFQQPVQDEEDDPWTEEEILKTVKRIIERLGIDGELQ